MRRAAVAAALQNPHAAAATAVPVPPPVIPPGDGGLSAVLPHVMHAAAAAAQGAGTAAQAVASVMMLAMVASAVVSTVSMSALMVQRAQQAEAPSPAAALAALINPPQPTPRPTVARRERAPPIQQVTETSVSRSIAWAPPAPPAAPASHGDGSITTTPNPHEIHVPSATPVPLGCNVTYTKTVTTITMEPTGNVSHSQTSSWFVPCSEAPSLPPVGAPDPAIVTRSVSLIGRPQADHTGDDGSAAGPNIDDSTILFGPGVTGAPAPAPGSAGAGNTLAALLAALSPSGAPGNNSQLAALLAADPSLRNLLPPGALAALGPSSGEDGDLGGSGAQYDIWGRPVTDPAREAADDAAENAVPLLVARNSPQRSQEEREADIARARAEQRAWWDAELERARKETHGGPRPVDFSHKAGEPTASEAHPVQFHVATDLAQEGLAAEDSAHWDVKSEVFNYVERMEWKHELRALPARRFLRDLGRQWSAARTRRRQSREWLGHAGSWVRRLQEAACRAVDWLPAALHRRLARLRAFSWKGRGVQGLRLSL